MTLELVETIFIHTDTGIREIQLCLGDITTLPKSSETDFIMVSSFPDNYSAVQGTLIGALWKAFRLSVRDLARNKAEDLRRHFHCWISHELPKELPYRRLLCFEQSIRSDFGRSCRTAIVSEIFRALFTTFGDSERSVITPLLATGNQNTRKKLMLRCMVTSCAAWMRAGLPLSRMVLVIYHPKPKAGLSSQDDVDAVAEFRKLKKSLEVNMIVQDNRIDYDLYTAFSSFDQVQVDMFLYRLREVQERTQSELRVLTSIVDQEEQLPLTDAGDEDEPNSKRLALMQTSMLRSKRVLIFLSPNFMMSLRGMEEYNLALALGQRTRRQVLAPVYLTTIPDLPTYMALSQWVDCRHKERDAEGIDKIGIGVLEVNRLLSEQLPVDALTNSSSQKAIVGGGIDRSSLAYDLFISYSHKDAAVANLFLQAVKDADPGIRIFFDRDEIKTGHSWQTSLYGALTNSRIVLALMSTNYTSSIVCQEEMSIALSQHMTGRHSTLLLPLVISTGMLPRETEEQDTAVAWVAPVFGHLPVLVPRFVTSPHLGEAGQVDSIERSSFLLIRATAAFIAQRITGKELSELAKERDLFEVPSIPWEIDTILEASRIKFFRENWIVDQEKSRFSLKVTANNVCDSKLLKLITVSDEQKNAKTKDASNKVSKDEIAKEWAEELTSIDLKDRRIVISYSGDEEIAAKFLKSRLLIANATCSVILANANFTESMRLMDSGDVIICLLTSTYVTLTSSINNLLIALSRHRGGSALLCPVLLNHLPTRPTFLQLIPARLAAYEQPFSKLSTFCLPIQRANFNIEKHKIGGMVARSDSNILPINVQLVLEATAQWVIGRALYCGISKVSTPVILSPSDLKVSGYQHAPKMKLDWQHFKALKIPSSYVNAALHEIRSNKSSQISAHCQSSKESAVGTSVHQPEPTSPSEEAVDLPNHTSPVTKKTEDEAQEELVNSPLRKSPLSQYDAKTESPVKKRKSTIEESSVNAPSTVCVLI